MIMMSDPQEVVEGAELKRIISDVLRTLTPREERILRLRYWHGATGVEIGRHFGFSANRSRQIEEKALQKLKHPSRSLKLRPYAYGNIPYTGTQTVGLELEEHPVCVYDARYTWQREERDQTLKRSPFPIRSTPVPLYWMSDAEVIAMPEYAELMSADTPAPLKHRDWLFV